MPRQRSIRAISEGSSVTCSAWWWPARPTTGGSYAWLGLGLSVVRGDGGGGVVGVTGGQRERKLGSQLPLYAAAA